MDKKKPFKEMGKTQGTWASLYQKNISMQLGNLKNLLEYLVGSGIRLPEGKYLDLGCGTGILARELQKKCQRIKIIYYGIDLAHDTIKKGKSKNPSLKNLIVGDIEHLPFKEESFDVGISNSTLHWENVPKIRKTPKKALAEIFRVLKIDSPLAISVSGYGSTKKFQESYHEVIKRFKNHPKFDARLYREDPVGNMHLIDLVNILIDVGFKIKRAQLDYEPVKFKSHAHYVNAVKGYGYTQYVAPFPESERQNAWQMIKYDFITKSRYGKYEHQQYMIYVIALKTKNKGNFRFRQKR